MGGQCPSATRDDETPVWLLENDLVIIDLAVKLLEVLE